MRRRTKLALVAGGATAAIAGGAILRGRLGGRGSEALPPDDEAMFTVFAPGGPRGFWFNGPVAWAFAKFQPIVHAGVYKVVAEMLEVQPEDDLLDIGCGPGAFLATRAAHARRVVGLDPSRVMLREVEKRLADRIADGTAQLVLGSSAALPFSDGGFSAVTAITAPANLADAQVSEVAPRRARPDAHALGGVLDGSASGDVGGEHVHLALSHAHFISAFRALDMRAVRMILLA